MKINLAEIAGKLGKTATDIARETGINRNTVNALMKGEVSDLRISTLEKIAKTYGVSVFELMQEDSLVQHAATSTTAFRRPRGKVYKQEAESPVFTSWPWMRIAGIYRAMHNGRPVVFGALDAHFKKDYVSIYWDFEKLRTLAEAFYEIYGERAKYTKLYREYMAHATRIEELYFEMHDLRLDTVKTETFMAMFKDLRAAYDGFFNASLFIDAFDTGVDHERIAAIAEKNRFDKNEVAILTTPADMTFADERKLALLLILRGFRGKNRSDMAAYLKKHADEIEKYRKQFDYWRSNYVDIKHISSADIKEEAEKYAADRELFKKEFSYLESYSENKRKGIDDVLKRHRLKENPLWFFSDITYLREHRKKTNLMGFHVIDFILSGIEEKTGIPKKFLRYLSFDEVDNVMKGLVSAEVLKQRYNDGVLVAMRQDGYKLFEGAEAESIKDEIEAEMAADISKVGKNSSGANKGEPLVISGQTASQGYAKGVARIVLTQSDFGKFKLGEILVTSMTRPEFVPLMKIAAAIVTNEGGITCHAAIVSRELGKPCVIATKIATQTIKDGDTVEVRANHGTVRILK